MINKIEEVKVDQE